MKATEIALILSIGINFLTILIPIFTKILDRKYYNEDRKRKFEFDERIQKYESCLGEIESMFSGTYDNIHLQEFNASISKIYLICSDEAKKILDQIMISAQGKSRLSSPCEFDDNSRSIALENVKLLREVFRKEIAVYSANN